MMERHKTETQTTETHKNHTPIELITNLAEIVEKHGIVHDIAAREIAEELIRRSDTLQYGITEQRPLNKSRLALKLFEEYARLRSEAEEMLRNPQFAEEVMEDSGAGIDPVELRREIEGKKI